MKDQKSLIINSLTSFKEMQVRQPPEGPFKSTWLPVIFVVTWVFEITVQEKKGMPTVTYNPVLLFPVFS